MAVSMVNIRHSTRKTLLTPCRRELLRSLPRLLQNTGWLRRMICVPAAQRVRLYIQAAHPCSRPGARRLGHAGVGRGHRRPAGCPRRRSCALSCAAEAPSSCMVRKALRVLSSGSSDSPKPASLRTDPRKTQQSAKASERSTPDVTDYVEALSWLIDPARTGITKAAR